METKAAPLTEPCSDWPYFRWDLPGIWLSLAPCIYYWAGTRHTYYRPRAVNINILHPAINTSVLSFNLFCQTRSLNHSLKPNQSPWQGNLLLFSSLKSKQKLNTDIRYLSQRGPLSLSMMLTFQNLLKMVHNFTVVSPYRTKDKAIWSPPCIW